MEPNEDPREVAAAAVLADGKVEVDLRERVTRESLGVAEGAKTAILENDDMSRFSVTVTFSDGHVLSSDEVKVMTVETDPSGEVSLLTLGLRQVPLDEVERLVRAGVDEFGVDERRATSFLSSARAAESSGNTVDVALPAEGVAPPELLEIVPTVFASGSGHVVNYYVHLDVEEES
ncbi:hypothetical protein [Nocardioides daphniae]|uniref:hypothetical protein n=1 Tax=Nocardioides daphniae TaxID=402297 RepID=UPI0016698D2D|nr:hypothetical protein [Nocardioides daphniae]